MFIRQYLTEFQNLVQNVFPISKDFSDIFTSAPRGVVIQRVNLKISAENSSIMSRGFITLPLLLDILSLTSSRTTP